MRRTLLAAAILAALAAIVAGALQFRGQADGRRAAESPVAADPPVAPNDGSPQVVVYYFHRTLRCGDCLAIERLAHDCLHEAFPGELAAGWIVWRALNIEHPEHAHYEREFELKVASLILAEYAGDQCTRWRLLPDVWHLVDDPIAFSEYVRGEIADFLGE